MSDCYDTTEFSHHGHKFIARFYYDEDMGAPWQEHDGHGPVSDFKAPSDKRPGEIALGEPERGGACRFYDWQEAMKIARRDGWGLDDKAKLNLIDRLGVTRIKWQNGKSREVAGVDMAQRLADGRPMLTRGEIAAQAVMNDYRLLDRWARDQWRWIGISVSPMVPNRARLEKAIDEVINLCGLTADSDLLRDIRTTLEEARDADDEYKAEDYSNALWGIESDNVENYHDEVMRELADQIIAEMESN